MDEIKEQLFFCKKCQKEFSVKDIEKYINYNCPECNSISPFSGYSGLKFKGLPTIKG